MSTDLAVIAPIQESLSVYRPPDTVLQEAHTAAAALKKVIDAKPKKVTFNGEQYLEFEDWQTLARFYGVTSVVRSTKYVEYGSTAGFEATADALLVASNQVISSADAMCLNDEANWGKRAKYEWKEKLDASGKKVWNPALFNNKGGYERERTLVGEEVVPLFQLRSMAQTRACAKALRNVLAWVVVLAGYRPTPAEEMQTAPTMDELRAAAAEFEKKSPHAENIAKAEAPVAEILQPESKPAPSGKPVISEPQSKRLYAISRQHGWSDADVRNLLGKHGFETSREITRDKYEAICTELEQRAKSA